MSGLYSHSSSRLNSDGKSLNQQKGDQEGVAEYSEVYALYRATFTAIAGLLRDLKHKKKIKWLSTPFSDLPSFISLVKSSSNYMYFCIRLVGTLYTDITIDSYLKTQKP